MKTNRIILLSTLAAALTIGAGCQKKEEPPAVPEPPKGSSATVGEAAKAVTDEAAKAAEQAKAAASSATAAAQKLIDQAKQLMADKKYQEALATLGNTASMALTPEQQKMVADLKAQLQKLLASTQGGAQALEGVLGGKK